MNNDQVEIKPVKAVDVSKLPTIKSGDRQIVLMEGNIESVDGFLISIDNKSIFVVKDVLTRNVKGPASYRWW